jgi:CubicO group peptidase (beta-lactamase class C family)
VKSVSKSLLSALVGIALEQGKLTSLERPVADILADYYQPVESRLFALVRAPSDAQRRRITIRHLLTMTGGQVWDESSAPLVYALLMSSNPVRFAAELPVPGVAGASFNYSTAASHLLAGALARATREPNRAFAERQLLNPAGITLAGWDADPQGVHFGGSEMFLTTRNMLKFGILYLRQGRVGDQQVVPARWIAESFRKQTDVGMTVYQRMIPNLTGYGYLWWLRSAGGHAMACALGLGGQFILVVPSLELVVAGTSALDGRNPGNEKQFNGIFELVDRTIVAAAR